MTTFVTLTPKTYMYGGLVPTMARARSVHAILRAQSVHGQYSVIRCPNIDVFGISPIFLPSSKDPETPEILQLPSHSDFVFL